MARTLERLSWHAGLSEHTESTASVSSCTWPPGRVSPRLDDALADLVETLCAFNLELNGAVPSSDVGQGVDSVPRTAAYAVVEIVRMLRESQLQAMVEDDARTLGRAAWRVETAWAAVLAGDIDDIRAHLELEESARLD